MRENTLKTLVLFSLFTFGIIRQAFSFGMLAEYILNEGMGYYHANRYDEALREFNKVLILEPGNESAKKSIDMIFAREIARIRERVIQAEIAGRELDRFQEFVCYGLTPEECLTYLHGHKGGLQEDYRGAKFAINSQVSSFTGDYGDTDDKRTTVTYFSETFKYIGRAGEISLGMPYSIRNGGGVTAGESSVAGTRSIPKRADGIGDLTLKGEYYWLAETGIRPSVDLSAKVKFPLASRDRGLGTGRYDFGTGVSLMKRFDNFLALLDLSLLVRQRPNASQTKTLRLDYSSGFGYIFSPKISAYLFVDSSTRPAKNQNKPLELTLACSYKPQRKYSLNAYLLFGLSRSSPDFGASTGITRYF